MSGPGKGKMHPTSPPPFSGLHAKSKPTNNTNYKAHLCKKQRFQVTQHKNSNLKRLTESCEPFPTGTHSSGRTSKRLCLGRRQLVRPLVMSALHSSCAFTLQHQTFVPLVPLSLNTSLQPNFLTLSLFGKITLKKINIYAIKPEDKINRTQVS